MRPCYSLPAFSASVKPGPSEARPSAKRQREAAGGSSIPATHAIDAKMSFDGRQSPLSHKRESRSGGYHAHRIAAFRFGNVAGAARPLAKRTSILAPAVAGTGRARPDVGRRTARHRRHLRRALDGNQQALLARIIRRGAGPTLTASTSRQSWADALPRELRTLYFGPAVLTCVAKDMHYQVKKKVGLYFCRLDIAEHIHYMPHR